MKINKIDLITVNLPLKKSLRVSFGTIENRETLIIKFYTDDGFVGYGESPLLKFPISEPETISSGIDLLKSKICPLIVNKTFDDILDLKTKVLAKYSENPVTKIGLEGAFYHLMALKKKTYLGKLFGATNTIVQACETIGISDDPEYILTEVEKFIKKGYKRLKIKIAPNRDIKVVKIIRKKYKDLELAVDANASYNANHPKIFKELDKFNIAMIEQPFKAQELSAHAKLQVQIKTPVCLDESIKSLSDAKKAIKMGCCKIINIKPARIGSYYGSIEIHNFCFENNIDVFAGGRLESGIGKVFNLALAGLPGYNLPIDMSSSLEYFSDDIIDPFFDTVGGSINIPNNVGLGFEVNEEKIKKYTTDRITIE